MEKTGCLIIFFFQARQVRKALSKIIFYKVYLTLTIHIEGMGEKELKPQKAGFVSFVFYHEQNVMVLDTTQNTGLESGFEILLCNARGSECLFFH